MSSTAIGHKQPQQQRRTRTSKVGIITNPLPVLVYLLQLSHLLIQETTFAATTMMKAEIQQSEQCVVSVGGSTVLKDIGSVWKSLENPCKIHSCEIDDANNGIPHEVTTDEDCSVFQCEKDAELRHEAGTCCGACVRTKCLFNNTAYNIGETWHNPPDCTILECSQLGSSGQPMISAYKKTCPPLPYDCPTANIYERDCCRYCREPSMIEIAEEAEVLNEEFYRNHPCIRTCKANAPPMTCRYTFTIEWFETLSKACFECPQNGTDCQRPHCIAGDGIRRSVTVVNRMMPGPSIEVCLNDTIVVDVKNRLLGESTTVHWHGMHQKDTPYMDGVPHISQCPIPPHSTFRYSFRAANGGTHFWHSHTGMQRGDGVFGALIVRVPKIQEVHAARYDYDLPEHKIIVQDWAHMPGVSMFAAHHHSVGDNKPRNVLVNGKGRYFKQIFNEIDEVANDEDVTLITPTELPASEIISTTHVTETEAPTTLRPHDISYYESYDILHPIIPNPADNMEIDIHHSLRRIKRSTFAAVPLDKIPLERFNVKAGFRYRFRVINAEFLNCPITLSIDSHTLTVISSDGYDMEAREVSSVVTYAGERFDFVVTANQTIASYWIRFKGLMDCDQRFESAFQVAVLHYEGAADMEPSERPAYEFTPGGIELNAMNKGPGYEDSLTIAELSAVTTDDETIGLDEDTLKPEADYKFFVYYDFYAKNNPEFHPQNLYGFNETTSTDNQLFTPQLNHISMKFPAMPLLPYKEQLDDSMFCNETSLAAQGIDCRKQFCKCHHVLQVPLNAVVELIIVDEGFTYEANHPFHLHGNAFRVVALERLGENVTVEMVKELDASGGIKRNLHRAPIKDTVTIPDGGYTIVRFKAYNPGYWLFHCHIEFHAEIGMAIVLKVGENSEMRPVPKNFPTCGNYVPDEEQAEQISPSFPSRPTPNGTQTQTTSSGRSSRTFHRIHRMQLAIYVILCFLMLR